ncbi:UNVERIFIED_CONTAM: hypothetical protein HHA_318380 [Hammondia hammondi]|eukprot:XP_008885261.1 hypothetical protein HHA_318380 [Hammondia hammondi]
MRWRRWARDNRRNERRRARDTARKTRFSLRTRRRWAWKPSTRTLSVHPGAGARLLYADNPRRSRFPPRLRREAESGLQLLAVDVAVLRRRGSSFSSLWPLFMALFFALSAGAESPVDSLELRVSVGTSRVFLLSPSISSSDGMETMFRDRRGKNLRENREKKLPWPASCISGVSSFLGVFFSRGDASVRSRDRSRADLFHRTSGGAAVYILHLLSCCEAPPSASFVSYTFQSGRRRQRQFCLCTQRGSEGRSAASCMQKKRVSFEGRRVAAVGVSSPDFRDFFRDFSVFSRSPRAFVLRERSARARGVSPRGAACLVKTGFLVKFTWLAESVSVCSFQRESQRERERLSTREATSFLSTQCAQSKATTREFKRPRNASGSRTLLRPSQVDIHKRCACAWVSASLHTSPPHTCAG